LLQVVCAKPILYAMNSNNQRLLFGNTFSLGLLYVLLPLALAGGIYIAFRSSPPLLLSAMIELLPYNAHPFKLGSNFDWLVYNVPDGLWSFSFTSFLLIACRNDRPATRKLYLASGSILMVCIEVAQAIHDTGALEHAQRCAVAEADMACKALDAFPASVAREALLNFCAFAVGRDR